MAARKYLKLSNGRKVEESAIQVSAGAVDDGKIPALDAAGRLHPTFMPVGIGADTLAITCSEALSAGNFINIWDDAGTPKVRKADATTSGKEADGFVLEAAAAGTSATVYFEGSNTQLTGLTVGARYYLDTTAGGATATPPNASGNIVQYLGRAVSATQIAFEAEDGVILA